MPDATRPVPGGPAHRRSLSAALVQDLVRRAVIRATDRSGRRTLDILDAGGGTGSIAVPLALDGHRVTVVDPSPDSLASLERRAADAGVLERVTAVQGDLSALRSVVRDESADLVLCHHVLEVVDVPGAALQAMAAASRPTGSLSLIAANRYASVVSRVLAGRLSDAFAILQTPEDPEGRGDPDPSRRRRTGNEGTATFTADELCGLVERSGYTVVAAGGVRVFADLVPAGALQDSSGVESLQALERAARDHPAFLALAAGLHVLADRGSRTDHEVGVAEPTGGYR